MSYLNNWRPDGSPLERPQPATIDLTCHHCRKTTRVLTKSIAERESEYWKERHGKLLAALNDVVERCHKKHGSDPMERWFSEELLKVRDRLERGF